jgi:hypothetical protein
MGQATGEDGEAGGRLEEGDDKIERAAGRMGSERDPSLAREEARGCVWVPVGGRRAQSVTLVAARRRAGSADPMCLSKKLCDF